MRVGWVTPESLTDVGHAAVDGTIAKTIVKITRCDFVGVDDIGMLSAGQAASEALYYPGRTAMIGECRYGERSSSDSGAGSSAASSAPCSRSLMNERLSSAAGCSRLPRTSFGVQKPCAGSRGDRATPPPASRSTRCLTPGMTSSQRWSWSNCSSGMTPKPPTGHGRRPTS